MKQVSLINPTPRGDGVNQRQGKRNISFRRSAAMKTLSRIQEAQNDFRMANDCSIIFRRFIRPFFCSGRTGSVAQRLLLKSRCCLLYKRFLERMGVLRLGSMGLKRGSSFLRVKSFVKKSGHLSP